MRSDLRETPRDRRPATLPPRDDFDGVTRASALEMLLRKHVTGQQNQIDVLELEAAALQARIDRVHRRAAFFERLGKVLQMFTFAGIIWIGPKLTPQEAADILRPNQTVVAPSCERCDGPYVHVMEGKPALSFPPAPPARRLDGTLLTQPVQVYGRPVGTAHHRR